MTASRWRRARAWIAAADLTVPVVLVAVGVLALVFAKVGAEVSERATDRLDQRILLALRAAPDDPLGPRWFEAAVVHISALGSGAVTTLIALIAIGYALLAGRPRFAALVAACSLGTVGLMALLKGLYERPRPTIVTQLDPPGGMSFPSGHSMIAMALYMTLAVLVARTLPTARLRRFTIVVGLALTFLIGASRMYLGVHYPTDVIAGWTAGGAWALACGALAFRLGRRGQLDQPPPPPRAP
ncbi:MAG: phosphatase PAP2 family protein [Myxococcales bacterium]|nr:phosphatase PAP2 family protein [Myxococcales bacterium]